MREAIMKHNELRIHNRVIRLFVVEKCRFGGDCKRSVCRFGHPEKAVSGHTSSRNASSSVVENRSISDPKNNNVSDSALKTSFIKLMHLPVK